MEKDTKKKGNTKNLNKKNGAKNNNKAKMNNVNNKNKNNNKSNIKAAEKKEQVIKNKDKKLVDEEVETVKEVSVEEKEEIVNETKDKDEVVEKIDYSEPEAKNNKTTLIALLAILLIIVGVCIYYQLEDKEDNKETVSETESNEIMDEFSEYFNNKKEKIIYYASSSCGYCELQTPIMEQLKKDYDIDYLYIDATKLTSSDKKSILDKLGIEHATPTTVVVKNGKVIGKNIGYVDGAEMVEFLIKNKILEDDAVYTPEANLTFIDYSDFNDLLEEDGKIVVTIGQTGCSHCIKTKPVLNNIAKENDITINYLNLTDMSEDEQNEFFDSLKEIGYDDPDFLESGSFGTPLTLIIEDGEVINYVSGESTPANFTRAFKKSGVISE